MNNNNAEIWVLLDNAVIDDPGAGSPFKLNAGAKVRMTLADGTNNELKTATYDNAGLQAPDGTTLTIEGFNGVLTVQGGDYSAGIGSAFGPGGTITIASGVVTATGGYGGAGIGDGSNGGGAGTIKIYGGTVVGTRGTSAPNDIGFGYSNSGGSIAIYGGSVNPTNKSIDPYPTITGSIRVYMTTLRAMLIKSREQDILWAWTSSKPSRTSNTRNASGQAAARRFGKR